jgi:predicted RNase H-like nuclease (RuvC/YqgF family)
MTKEQAIEILEGLKKSNEACIKSSKIEDTPFTTIWKRQNEAIETVLSMLKEKDKQIDKLKKHNDELLRKLRNRVKEVKKLQKYSLYKEEFSKLNKQLQNKDKIIDLMAEFIEDELTVDEFCTKEGCYADNYIDGHCEKCLNCIKQYFENKEKEVK